MDYVKPTEIAGQMLTVGATKANLPPRQLLVRGMLVGAYLAVATSMSVTAAVQTGQWIVGAMIFPFGLCLVVLLGTELITGSIALLPLATLEGKPGATVGGCFRIGAGCFSVISWGACCTRGSWRLR